MTKIKNNYFCRKNSGQKNTVDLNYYYRIKDLTATQKALRRYPRFIE